MTVAAAGPPARFPLGIVPAFLRDPLGSVAQWSRDYGPVIALPVVPGFHLFMVNHPDTVRELLVDQAANFEKPPQFKKVFRAAFGNGLFFSEGAFWKRQRKLMQPTFHHKHINNYSGPMVAQTHDMLDGWRSGETRRIDLDLHALTLRIVIRSIFDADSGERANRFRATLSELGELLGRQTFSLANIFPEWFPAPILIRKRQLSHEIDRIVYEFIAEKRAVASPVSFDLLSLLMRAIDEDTGLVMSDRQLHDEVLTIFVAGHETSAKLVGWALALVAQHPEVEAALHDEVDRVGADGWPSSGDLASMPVTEQIIRETLRLYPIAWINFRQALQDTMLGGVRIPRGSQVWFIPYALHHSPAYFDEPERFLPERFRPGWEDRILKYSYFPFGGGPRVCIGNGFAMLETRLILATIASRYRLSLPDQHKVEVQPGPVLSVKGGLPMRVTAR